MKKYDLRKIMKRAWELVKKAGATLSAALKKAWQEAKNMAKEIKNVVVAHFDSYNQRRYSKPWVCLMTDEGKFDFSKNVGDYTGNHGDSGDLVIYKPVIGQVYGWGQKDYRGNNTIKNYCKWTENGFVACNKIGN